MRSLPVPLRRVRGCMLAILLVALAACQRSSAPAASCVTSPTAPPGTASEPAAPVVVAQPAARPASPPAPASPDAKPRVRDVAPFEGAKEVDPRSDVCPSEYPKDADAIAVLTRCEVAARTASGPSAGPLLFAFGKLCDRFGGVCNDSRCHDFMRGRPDLFRDYEIHGWLCNSGLIYREVIARFPRTEAADDAAWESAVRVGGECESFIDCEVFRSLQPLQRYRASFPQGRHLADAVQVAVRSLEANLPRSPNAPVGGEGGGFPEILKRYEEAATGLAPALRARILRALAPWWERIGEPAHAKELTAEAARIDP